MNETSAEAVRTDETDIPDPVLTPVGLPDLASQTGALDTNAKLVWAMVRFTALEPPLRPHMHEGQEGYLWEGTQVSVLNDIWPILRNPGSTTADIKLRLSQYLKLTHNMVCLNKGSRPGTKPKRLPLWWVRKSWLDRLEDFRMVVTWPDAEQEEEATPFADSAAFESADVFDDAPLPQSEPETEDGPRVLTCDFPGCADGPDGGPYTTTRANTMPLHRRSHENTRKIIEAAAVLLANRTEDSERFLLADVAREAGLHPTTIHMRFTREELLASAQELIETEGRERFLREPLAEPEPVEEPEIEPVESSPEQREWATRLLQLAAFGDVNGTPLTYSAFSDVIKIIPGDLRHAAWNELANSGQIITRRDTDTRGRGRDVIVAADRDAVLASIKAIKLVDDDTEDASVPVDTATPMDFATVLAGFLKEYEARAQQLQTKDDVIATQQEVMDAQKAKLSEARSELDELRQLIAPLLSFGKGVKE